MYLINWIAQLFHELGPAFMLLWPTFLLLNICCFRNWKHMSRYFLFALYLAALYRAVGLPDLLYCRFHPALHLIPFAGMWEDWQNAVLNLILFLPLGWGLPLLWKKLFPFRKVLLSGFLLSVGIELLQILTYRTTDVNDVLTNTAGTALGCLAAVRLRRPDSPLSLRKEKRDFWITVSTAFAEMYFVYPLLR